MNRFKLFFTLNFVFLLCTSFIMADDMWVSSRPDGHAPIGIMGDHVHAKGEWMFSFRTMTMKMEDNRKGTSRLSTDQVFNDYMIAPLRMDMKMHMLGAMYGAFEGVTVMAMVPYLDKSMDHKNRMGREFSTEASGLGDIQAGFLFPLMNHHHQGFHLGLGASLPTGSIEEKDNTPMGPNQQLPYPMQLGSGTYDFLPSLTYLGQSRLWSWGSQAKATLRLGKNNREYTLGDQFELNTWIGRQLLTEWSTSLRAMWLSWGDLSGADPALNPNMVPTADPTLRAGDRVDLIWGLNFFRKKGFFKGHRLAFEIGAPVYQRLDGPQLETDLTFTLGWQKAL